MYVNGLSGAVSSKGADNTWIIENRVLSVPCRQLMDNLLTCNKFFEFEDDDNRYSTNEDLYICLEIYDKLKKQIKMSKKLKLKRI